MENDAKLGAVVDGTAGAAASDVQTCEKLEIGLEAKRLFR